MGNWDRTFLFRAGECWETSGDLYEGLAWSGLSFMSVSSLFADQRVLPVSGQLVFGFLERQSLRL